MSKIRTKPFLSRSQLRKCYALRRAGLRSWDCDKWVKETNDIKKLPDKVSNKEHSSIIYGLWPEHECRQEIIDIANNNLGINAVPYHDVHLTLQFVGEWSKYRDDVDKLLESQLSLAMFWLVTYGLTPICGVVNGYGRFRGTDRSNKDAIYLTVDSKPLIYLKENICRSLAMVGIEPDTTHGFIPHITIGYIPSDDSTPDIRFDPFDVHFKSIILAFGDRHLVIPIVVDDDYDSSIPIKAKSVWTRAFINDLPDSAFLFIESGGKKDDTGKTVPRSKRHFPYKDTSGKVDLPHLRNAIARIPQSNAPGLNKAALQKRAQRLLGVRNKSNGFFIFKDNRGEYRWVSYSSNPYLDIDKEYVTLKALKDDVEEMNRTGEYGPLRWWHEGDPYLELEDDWRSAKAGPGLDLGMCDWADMHGNICIESGTFKSKKIAVVMSKHADRLEISKGFSHPGNEPDNGGGFLHMKTIERSLTPINQASNLFTAFLVSSKEHVMNPKRRKALADLGVDIEEVEERANGIQRKADASGVPMRAKTKSAQPIIDDDDDDDRDVMSIADKMDQLTSQLNALTQKMSEDVPDIQQEEKLEDLMVGELTVGELQDIVKGTISKKSLEPLGEALRAILESQEEIKEILTSKSVQSVVDEVSRMKAKLERLQARSKAIGSKVRELADEEPRGITRKGMRPSESEGTLFDDLDDADLAQKAGDNNPFAWVDDFVNNRGK